MTTTLAGETEAEALAYATSLPATNAQGDPLTLCRNHHDRVIYAVATLGADRDLCAECREPRNRSTTSVADVAGHPADADATRSQIGTGVLMACGARDLVRDDPNGLLMFRVGPGGKKVRKVLVRLTPSDTYAVEYGYTDMNVRSPRFLDWVTVEQEFGVYAEQLAATVRRLGDRETY